MDVNAFVRTVALTLTRQEDITNKDAQDALYRFALAIYWLLLRQLPEGQLERLMAWQRLRPRVIALAEEAAAQLHEALTPRLIATEAALQEPTAQLYGVAPLPPRPIGVVLAETRVLGIGVSRLLTPSPAGAPSPFATQLVRLLERTLLPQIMRDSALDAITASILTPRTTRGRTTLLPRKGTAANAFRERFRSITAASFWALTTPTLLRYATQTGVSITEWRWNAILDPKTCPVCRPLHNTTAPLPAAFPHGAPPLHPNCRCYALPVISARS